MKTILTCASLLGGLLSSPAFDIKNIKIDSKQPLSVRAATENDVEQTTTLIHSAYSYWVQHGVVVSPATQTDETTRKHLLGGRGFVATDNTGKIQATFSLDNVELAESENKLVARGEQAGTNVSYEIFSESHADIGGRYLEFKKLAVDPSLAEQGIGRALYDVAEDYARTHGYDGIVLETVKEATWLYDWYLRMGFTAAGSHVYKTSKLETLLLVKRF